MKKIVLALLVIATAYTASAQRVGYGLKGGLNISMLSDKDIDLDAKVNFNVGGFMEYDFTEEWAAEVALIYSRQGAKMKSIPVSLTESFDGKIMLDYINLPIVAKFYPFDGMNIFLGPQLSFLVSARQKLDEQDSFSVKSDWKGFDMGVVGGVGYSWEMGMIVYAQYNWGFMDIYKGEEKVRNGVIQIGIGWRF